jgi:hypothetical protein
MSNVRPRSIVSHSPGRFARATQKVRGFSSVIRLAGKLSLRADDAVVAFRYDSSIHPVNSSSRERVRFVGSQCGKSPKRVSTYSWPSASKPAGWSPMRRSKFQFTPIHGVPVFHQLPWTSWNVLPCPAPWTKPPGL